MKFMHIKKALLVTLLCALSAQPMLAWNWADFIAPITNMWHKNSSAIAGITTLLACGLGYKLYVTQQKLAAKKIEKIRLEIANNTLQTTIDDKETAIQTVRQEKARQAEEVIGLYSINEQLNAKITKMQSHLNKLLRQQPKLFLDSRWNKQQSQQQNIK